MLPERYAVTGVVFATNRHCSAGVWIILSADAILPVLGAPVFCRVAHEEVTAAIFRSIPVLGPPLAILVTEPVRVGRV